MFFCLLLAVEDTVDVRRQSGRVVSASDLLSSGPGYESRSDRQSYFLDLFHGSPEFKPSATLVNRELVCLRQVAIIKNAMFILNYLFQLFARPH